MPKARSDFSEGGTLMHELGHNLSLGHGVTSTGPRAPANGPLWSPNYFSVMNYNYQTRGVLMAAAAGGGVPATSKIDFSDLDGCADLNEMALDETIGAQCALSTNYVLAYFSDAGGGQKFATAQTGAPINWNGNASPLETAATDNLNRFVDNDDADTFRSLNDWAYDPATKRFTTLQLNGTCHPWTLQDGVAPAAALSSHELSAPEIVAAGVVAPPIVNVTISIRPGCGPHWLSPTSSGGVPAAIYGSATFPVAQIDTAHLYLAGNAATSTAISDLNGDGIPDLLAHFPMLGMQVRAGDTSATLVGLTSGSVQFVATGAITVAAGSEKGKSR